MKEEKNNTQETAQEAPKTIGEMELESLRKQNQELQEYKDKYFRLLAEQENARKRLQKERQEMAQFAIQSFISEILHPLDHFERALEFTEQMSEEIKHWGMGFQMILTQFKDALHSQGVKPIEANPGDLFDPHLHEAIEVIETEEFPPDTIVHATTRGYKMGERTIRPARVKVAKIREEKDNNTNKEESSL